MSTDPNLRLQLSMDRTIAPIPITDPKQLAQAIRNALQVGSVLDVTVALDANQNPAVLINGQLMQAILPATVKPGEMLAVRVLANSDPLHLQILGSGKKTLPTSDELEIKSAFQEIIEALFPEKALEGLKSAVLKSSEVSKPSPFLRAPQEASSPETKESMLATKVNAFVHRLAEREAILTPQQLATPKDAQKVLQHLAQSHSQNLSQEFNHITTELIKLKLPAHEVRIFEAIKKHLDLITKFEGELTFNPATESHTPALNASQLKIYTDISRLMIDAPSSKGLEQVSKSLENINLKAGPLVLFLQSLSWLESSSSPSPSFTDKIAEALMPLYIELKTLRESKASDKDIRTALTKQLQRLAGIVPDSKQLSFEAKEIESLIDDFKTLENLVSAKELISSMNTLANGSGQPTLLMFPAILDGVLSAWILGAPHPRTEEKQGGKKHARNQNGYENVELALPFPGLGTIGVSLNFSEKEVLLSLNSENVEIAQFLSERTGELQDQIKEMGFEDIHIKSATGEPSVNLPEWYGELLKSLKVA